MKVTSIKVINTSDNEWKIEIDIEGAKPLYLCYHGIDGLPCANDCVALFLLIQAMSEGTDLFLPEKNKISEMLFSNMNKFQEVFSCWYPFLKKITIHAEIQKAAPSTTGSLSLFSGGADSFYTLVEKQKEISHLFLCFGLDIQLHETEKAEQVSKSLTNISKRYDKGLISVNTNIREVFPSINTKLQHGALLAAMVLALGKESLFIPASHNIDELHPSGSHALTDLFFNNGTTLVEHQGAVVRSKKLERISEDAEALKNLRVCNASEEFNCGECEKCIRTQFTLEVLGRPSSAIPTLSQRLSVLNNVKIYSEIQYTYWRDNYDFAIKHKQFELAKYARKIILSYNFRQWLKQGITLFKQLFTGTK